MPSNWNFYAGLNVGFYAWSSPKDYLGNNNTGLGLGGQIGGRYFFNNRWGLNLEFGGGNAFSGGKFGLTMKL
jgi:outer membrane immunogenic protein